MMHKFLTAAVIALVFAPTTYRAMHISRVGQYELGQANPAIFEVFRNDAPLLAIMLGLLALTMMLRNRWLKRLAFTSAALLHLVLIFDAIIFHQFSQRMAWSDVVKLANYSGTYLLDLTLMLLTIILLFVALLFTLYYGAYMIVRRVPLRPGHALIILAALSVSATGVWQGRYIEYIEYRLYQNVASYNRVVASEFRGYTRTTAKPTPMSCAPQVPLSGPVIIYMVESLSSYQTAFFGGENDWMPRFDDIARKNAALTNFYANGFITEDGELALLTTNLPLYPPQGFNIVAGKHFSGHWDPERSLPRIFNARGYDSYFITTADLNFSNTGEWATSIGFENVLGSTDPFYDGMPRSSFDAAPDAALIDHVLLRFSEAQNTPFMFVKTVTSHHPHIHPETGEQSVEAVMRYVDGEIGRLYDALETQNFFDTGHLIIVGDHRAMVPLTGSEVETLGLQRAYAQVPAVVVSRQLAPEPVVIDTPYSQVDLSNTLMGLFGGQMCQSPFKGSIWGDNPQPARHILHRRGDWRHQLSVFSGAQVSTVTLNGDDTNISGADPDAQAQIIDYVNTVRIRAGIAEQEHKQKQDLQDP